jgi:hypothetical protein
MSTIIRSDQLNWRPDGDGFAICLERRTSAILHVVPDKTYAGMWRVKFPDGSLSDMANLTRAKDAGRAHALAILHSKLRHQETPSGGAYVRQGRRRPSSPTERMFNAKSACAAGGKSALAPPDGGKP